MSNSFRTAKRVWRLLPALAASALALSSVASAQTSPRAGEVAGRYSILRAEDKDTGCMLTLDTRGRGPGGFKAQLAPACRDNGVVIFDPVGWSLDRGRLALVARKGHKTYFEYAAGPHLAARPQGRQALEPEAAVIKRPPGGDVPGGLALSPRERGWGERRRDLLAGFERGAGRQPRLRAPLIVDLRHQSQTCVR